MTTVERAGEALARRMSRRTGLSRAGSLLFAVVAALAAEGIGTPVATARKGCAYTTASDCSCNWPQGQRCTSFKESYCDGSKCGTECRILTGDDWPDGAYPTGCWCTATCRYGHKRGYYKCCDCGCGDRYAIHCGCQKFVKIG